MAFQNCCFAFVWKAKQFAFACFLLLIFLPVLFGTSELKICIPDFKSCIMADWGGEFSFFSRYSFNNWCKNWYLHFYKTYDPQIWQAGTKIWVKWSWSSWYWWRHLVKITWQTKNISTTIVPMITLWSRGFVRAHDKLKSFHYHCLWPPIYGLLPIKLHKTLIMWPYDIKWQTKTTISPLSECLWSPKLAKW